MHFLQDAKKDVLRDLKNMILNNLQLLLIMVIKGKTKTTVKDLLLEDWLLINFVLHKIQKNVQILSFYKWMVEMICNKINLVES
jgi:hypothetical protein